MPMPSQMRQLLQNLLGNALKFRRKDVAPVVQLGASIGSDGLCTITVTDNGIGFKPEYGEKIFRMFERLHARTQYRGHGHRPRDLPKDRRAARRHDRRDEHRRSGNDVQRHPAGHASGSGSTQP